MKIYKQIRILFLLALFISSSIVGQEEGRMRIRHDEFLIHDVFGDIKYPTPSCDYCEDFSFDWDVSFNTAFNNLKLLEEALNAKQRNWYNKQQNLIKEYIEEKLNDSFRNFEEAKNQWFLHGERKNIKKHTRVLKDKFNNLYNAGVSKTGRYLRELKLVRLREAEIRAGNIANSQFGFLEIKGISLKNITSLHEILQHKYTIEDDFANNAWRSYEYKYIAEKLGFLGSDFEQIILDLKNTYYKSFSDWDRLGLMQFLLNYEATKDLMDCTPCVLPPELAKFINSDMATQPVIEEYAKNNRGGDVSLFDPRYPQRHRYKYQNNFCGGYINYAAWEAEKQDALDKLLEDTSTAEFAFRNFVKELELNFDDYAVDYRNSRSLSNGELALILQKTEFIYSKINTISKENINQLSFADQQLVIQDILFVTMFPWIKDLASQLPSSAEEWKALFEIMKPILLQIGIEFVPLGGAYNSAIDTLNGINSGDKTAIALGVLGVIVEFTPLDQIKNFIQLTRYSKKGFKIFKLTRKFTSVIRTALANGAEIILDGSTVIFKKAGSEIARIVNNVMTFNYSGFGGSIITNPNKTTTVIGKWIDNVDGSGIKGIIESGLSKNGENIGGLNLLNFDGSGMTQAQQWLENRQWLDAVITRGDIIRNISNPFDNLNRYITNSNGQFINAVGDVISESQLPSQGVLSFFGREIDYLQNAGYIYNASLKTWFKP